jgi:hypothetical protein
MRIFKQWLYQFLQEKEIDMEETFEVETPGGTWNLIPVGCIAEMMLACTPENRKIVQKKLVLIDFHNGDVRDFLRYVARGMAREF